MLSRAVRQSPPDICRMDARLVVVCLLLCQAFGVQEAPQPVKTVQRAASEFRHKKALILEAENIVKTKSVTWCLAACLQSETCRAFNYGSTVCQLLEQDLCQEAGLKLAPYPSLSYYDLQESVEYEHTGALWSTPYCWEDGYCSPRCEPLLHLPRLNEQCERDFECQMRTGELAVCRRQRCKCAPGYYIAGNTTCEPLPVEGYSLFAGPVDGFYYKLSTQEANFSMAEEACTNESSAVLAHVPDGDTNRFLRELMRRGKVRAAYIGLTDEHQEGIWVWVANQQRLRTTQFWRPGAPDNRDDSEHCAQLTNEIDFGWEDVKCFQEARFFCQLPHVN